MISSETSSHSPEVRILVPQIQLILRVVNIPVVQQISVEIPQVQFLVFWEVVDMPVYVQRTGAQLFAEFPHFLRECGLRS